MLVSGSVYIYMILLYNIIICTYLDLPKGAEWMIRGAEKHHPLESNSTLWKMLVCTWICFFVGDYCGLHLGIHHHFAPPCGIIFLGSLFASTSNSRNHKSKVMKLPGEST